MLTTLMLGWMVLYADRTCLYPLLAVIAKNLSLSSAQAGSLTSAYFITYVAMQIPAGIIGDRIGLKKIMMTMFFFAGLGMAGLGLLGNTYYLLILFSALSGIGAGTYYPASFGTLFQIVPSDRRAINSAIISVGMAAGMFIGMTISGPVYEFSGNYRIPFLILTIPTFAMIAAVKYFVPAVDKSSPPNLRDYLVLLRDKNIWKVTFSSFTSLYGFWVAMTWGPAFLQAERGISISHAGLFTGLVAITSIPAGLSFGRLSDKTGRMKIAALILPLSALAILLLTHVTSYPAIIFTLLLYGMLSNNAIMPVMAAWLGDIVSQKHPGRMGAATGFFNCLIMSSAIIAPVLSGFLRDLTGSLVPAFIAASCIIFAGTLVIFITPVTKGQQQA
jgi:MFS family permease